MSYLKSSWRWLLLAALGMGVAFAPIPAAATAPAERHIRLEAGRFSFSPGVIAVNPGDRVTLELVSMDVVHGLTVEGYDLQTTAEPGMPGSLTFTADRSGAFRLSCSVTCGAMHPFMVGKLRVGPNELLWRSAGLIALAAAAGLWGFRKNGTAEGLS